MTTKKNARYGDHPIVRYVRSLPGDFLLPREAAQVLNMGQRTLVNLGSRDPAAQLGPSHKVRYGNIEVNLYSPERIEHIAAWREANPPKGPVAMMFTPAESTERRRKHASMQGFRKRAREAAALGQTAKAAKLAKRAEEIRDDLARSRAARIKQLTVPQTRGRAR